MARTSRAVAPGVATTMPVFAVEAAGGIVRDAGDNQLVDLGSGIAVTTVGVSAPRHRADPHGPLDKTVGLDRRDGGVCRGLVSDPAAPFGGVKQSGLGREGARLGLEEFTEAQYFSIDWS